MNNFEVVEDNYEEHIHEEHVHEEQIHEEHNHTHHEHSHTHTHVDADGNIYEHSHEHVHEHGHTHEHTQTKQVLNRMAKIIGHMQSIKRMVEDGKDCTEVLIQLSAVRSAINGVSKVILKDHMEHCIVDAVEDEDEKALEELSKAIDMLLK